MKVSITKELIEKLVEKGATYTPPKLENGVIVETLNLTTLKK